MANKADEAVATEGKVVTIHYTLTDDDGEVIDSSSGGEPLEYLHGGQNIVPGLERKGAPQAVPRGSFPPDADIQIGMQFAAESKDGHMMPIWISDIQGDQVFIDRNHPLAGVNLHFDIEVVAIRAATKQETDHGHPHGPHGHDH